MDHAKLLDVLTSLPVSRSILPRAVYFATSRPANHAICGLIDSSGYASGPIRRCLFIDYIIKCDIDQRIPILTEATPMSILIFSCRYYIISNASLVNNFYYITFRDRCTGINAPGKTY